MPATVAPCGQTADRLGHRVQDRVGDPRGVEDDQYAARQPDHQRRAGEAGGALQELLGGAVATESADQTAERRPTARKSPESSSRPHSQRRQPTSEQAEGREQDREHTAPAGVPSRTARGSSADAGGPGFAASGRRCRRAYHET